jgi:hypothetical protein
LTDRYSLFFSLHRTWHELIKQLFLPFTTKFIPSSQHQAVFANGTNPIPPRVLSTASSAMPPARIAKRKAAEVVVSSSDESLQKKSKSPLAGLPQNYYAPPSANMTPEELQAWRKEQRRERNRQSAAASRQQTKARIAELEGEVLKYKTQYEEMKRRMEGMERQIKLLTEFSEAKMTPKMQMVTPPASYPNSPSRSPVHELEEASLSDDLHPESISLHGFDRQLSNISQASFFTIFDCAPDKIASHPTGASAAAAASFIDSKEHLIPISRQA